MNGPQCVYPSGMSTTATGLCRGPSGGSAYEPGSSGPSASLSTLGGPFAVWFSAADDEAAVVGERDDFLAVGSPPHPASDPTSAISPISGATKHLARVARGRSTVLFSFTVRAVGELPIGRAPRSRVGSPPLSTPR